MMSCDADERAPFTATVEDARVVIIPAPYEGTVSYGRGTVLGPAAILAASVNMELYDEETGTEPYLLGIATAPVLPISNLTPEEMVVAVEKEVDRWLKLDKIPVVIGGEHSVTVGAVRACRQHYPELGVLQLDAHADLRSAYQGTPYSHASVMARLREIVPTAAIGIRSLSEPESGLLRDPEHFVALACRTPELTSIQQSLLSSLPEKIYITIDLDYFDPAVMPSVGTPEPGGYRWQETIDFLRIVFQHKEVVGFDIVELAPQPGLVHPDFTAARLIYKMIGWYQVADELNNHEEEK